jgi:hypothetical protein
MVRRHVPKARSASHAITAAAALMLASAAHAQIAELQPYENEQEKAVLPQFRVIQPCGAAANQEEIVVCGRRQRRSPYRLPLEESGFDPNGTVDSVSRERHRLYEVGESGIHSCTNVGSGGASGCTFKSWKEGYEQRGGRKTPRISVGVN